ncbi:hypothetical protein [Flavobacterium silvaticum]|uniref:Uncharacterized protein n=1 Tax=Flavobacterium silvaticum TaxID=1852020 RepID=A0A972JEY0_9FLAO|nr:hypothetical protein [Flavobacterium silvaticum]NMH26651.1 hypothetical protein [Flavobacterium silvaticum]
MPSGFSVFLFFLCAVSFAGFGIYSPFYFYLKSKNPTKYLKRWDADAFTILLTSGMVYLALWFSEVILFYLELKKEIKPEFTSALSGSQGYWFWLPPVFYFVLSQLFWVNKLREMLIPRLLIALFLFTGFTNIALLMGKTAPKFPFDWQLKPEYTASNYIILDYFLKTLIFLALLGAVYLLRNRQKQTK